MKPNRSVITSSAAALLEKTHEPFLLAIYKGEDLFASLIECAKKAQLPSASFSGFGAIKNVELGFFNEETKQYKNKLFPDIYELISMQGTITKFENEYFVHIHAAISDADYKMYAGHLHKAEVAIIVETTIVPFGYQINRKSTPEFGLKLIDAT